ncbi:MAG TPA: MBOAT family O-acyltransferase [Planctomycetaceae bacterium]|nr:MBOAT family O-acyltransferase [Planctomycetaceae bacterium]
MTFTTLTFFLFLALVFALYWSVRRRTWQNLLIVCASFVFYGWWDVRFCALMFLSSLVDFAAGWGLNHIQQPAARKLLLGTSLCFNLGLLGFFKYFNFFAESLQAACLTAGVEMDPVTLRIVLPVGISFYTFQTMGYAIDVYMGRMRASQNVIEYMAFVSFFPQLVAGPIERAPYLLTQFQQDRGFDYERAVDGCRMILWGMFKKLVIADRIARMVNAIYGSIDTSSGPQLAFATIGFAFQIYCDFSAYSDMATGTARLFGFDLMRNFAYPYFAQSITEFWRRWHISLSTWFRDYVYIPLGGSRTGKAILARNLMITFIVSGLWHGASWNFVIWGAIMGLGILFDVLRGRNSHLSSMDTPGGETRWPDSPALRGMIFTFAVVCLGWVFFRASTLSGALLAIEKMIVDIPSPAAWMAFAGTLKSSQGHSALAVMLLVLAIEWVQRRHQHPLVLTQLPRWQRWAVYTAIFWTTMLTGPIGDSAFIYFQF